MSHDDANAVGFLNASKQARAAQLLAELRRHYILSPQVQAVANDLDCMLAFGPPEPGSKRPARTYLLIGESGAGKSTILKRFLERHPPVADRLGDIMQVVYAEVPAAGTKIAAMRALLEALGVRLRTRETEADLTRLLVTHLRGMGVRVLILDEAQHLLNRRTGYFAYELADWFKSLANAGIALVIAGTPEAAMAFNLNEQLARRSMGAQCLRPFVWNGSDAGDDTPDGGGKADDNAPDGDSNESDGTDWLELLTALSKKIPLQDAKYLITDDMPHRLFWATGGYLGRLMDFLADVVMEAVMAETEVIDRDLLMLVEERRRDFQNPDWVNVFQIASLADYEPPTRDTSRQTRLRRGRRMPRQADIGNLEEAA
ncbi:TniB family NTP-binding protein [Falsiroseomonas sp. HW251]|uniref:TniB family NTP-binding protein n=1 Tax=Falsiroseomonas sp. HW251 TaxID=3390998 RepID=UPI003D31099D